MSCFKWNKRLFFSRLALPDSVWGDLLHPSHSLWEPVSPAWRPDPESPHQHYFLCFRDLHHAAGRLRRQVRRMASIKTKSTTHCNLRAPIGSNLKMIWRHEDISDEFDPVPTNTASSSEVKENLYSCHFCRLPILQGGTFALLTPALAMLSMPEWECPAWTNNASLVDPSSPVFIEVWQSRLRAVSSHNLQILKHPALWIWLSLYRTAAGLHHGGLAPPDCGRLHGHYWLSHALHWAFDHRPHRHSHRPVSVWDSWSQSWEPLGHLCHVGNHTKACKKNRDVYR